MATLPSHRKVILLILTGAFFSSLLFFISVSMGGLFYEEHEPWLNSLISGKLTPGLKEVITLYVLCHIGTTYFYSFLYHLFPSIEWISWANGFFIVLSGGLAWTILSLFMEEKSRANFIFKLTFLWLFLSSHLVLFNYTRSSFLLCGTALLLLAVIYRVEPSGKKRLPYMVVAILVFVLGLLTRPEPALVVLIFAGAICLMFLDGWKKPAAVLLIPGAISFALFAAIAFDRAHSTDFYKLVEPDLEYQIRVQHNCVPLSEMKNPYDSMRYEAAQGGLWSDPQHVSVAFLRSIVSTKRDYHTALEQWNEFSPLVWQVAGRHLPLLILSGLIALIFLWLGLRFLTFRLSVLWALFYLLFWGLIFTQTYLSKINDRSFGSLLSLYLLVQLTFYLAYIKQFMKGFSVYIVPGLVLFFSFVQLGWIVKEMKILDAERTQLQQQYAWVKKEAGGGILVLNGSSFIPVMLQFAPFQKLDYSGFKAVYLYDVFYLATLHPYKEFLSEECHCDVTDFSAFYRFLINSDKDVYLLSSEKRLNLVTRYLHTIHQLDCHFEAVPETNRPALDPEKNIQVSANLKLYRLKK